MSEQPKENRDIDAELMLKFRDGDESCFEELVSRNQKMVFNLVYRFLGNYPDAEDIAQDVFLRVYKASSTYTASARFSTWLYTICRNACFQAVRRPRPELSLNADPDDPHGTRYDEIIDPSSESPCDASLNKEKVALIEAAIAQLPEAQRMAILLRKYENLQYCEISVAMGISEAAVKSLLHRARQTLKEKLDDYVKT